MKSQSEEEAKEPQKINDSSVFCGLQTTMAGKEKHAREGGRS